jgi:hypothetical protein
VESAIADLLTASERVTGLAGTAAADARRLAGLLVPAIGRDPLSEPAEGRSIGLIRHSWAAVTT